MKDPFDLTDRVAVVTGAGGGLGTPICEGLAEHGADVALLDVSEETLRQSAAGVERAGRRALPLTVDVSDEASVKHAFAEIDKTFGKVDILVNLAYALAFGPPLEVSLADWERAWKVNVTGYFLCCREAAQRMIDRGSGGAIMNMSSIAGAAALGRGNFPYSVSKGGIGMMTKEMAVEWGSHGIRVNAILPCQFLTPGFKARAETLPPEMMDHFLSGIPLGHLGNPPEMVGPVLFLVSDASSMVSGVLLPVDGGNLAMNAAGTKG